MTSIKESTVVTFENYFRLSTGLTSGIPLVLKLIIKRIFDYGARFVVLGTLTGFSSTLSSLVWASSSTAKLETDSEFCGTILLCSTKLPRECWSINEV